jgi:hypothetical protein
MNKSKSQKSTPPISEQPDAPSWAKLVLGLQQTEKISHEKQTWVAMNCILDFLYLQPAFMENPAAIAPIVRLCGALRDLHRGKLHPMFAVPAKRGRRVTGMNVGSIKGIAARALNELMLAGVPKTDAASRVARACGELPELGRIKGDQVIAWRARCRARPGPGAPKDGPVRFAYSHELPKGLTRAESAEYLMGQLRELGRRCA